MGRSEGGVRTSDRRVPGRRVERSGDRDRHPRDHRHGAEPVGALLGGGDTGGRVALIRSVERRGCEPPLHRHRNEDEVVYVLEGELTFYVDGEERGAQAGSWMFLPRGSEHGYRVESEDARLLTSLMPAGLEGYYLELGGHETEPDIERLVTVAARYGVEITGPRP